MKAVGKIFSIIGGALGIILGFGLVLSGISYFLLSVPDIKAIFLSVMEQVDGFVPFDFMKYTEIFLNNALITGIISLVLALFSFIAGYLSFSCHKKKTYIPTLVFGVLSGCQVFIILGAIFGMIFDKEE